MVCNGDTKKKHTYTLILLVCTWRHGGHVGGREQKHFSPLGTKLYFHVHSSRKYSFVLTPNKHGRLFTWLQTKNKIPADLTWNHQPVNNYCKTCNNSRAISRGNITWDQAQFERFSYILSNGHFSFRLARRNVQSETKIEPDLRLGAIS